MRKTLPKGAPVWRLRISACRRQCVRKSFSVGELAAVGVKRISLATSLYRAAMTGLLDAACELKDTGQFGFLDRCVTTPELNKLMRI